jgi:hypothetical protein
MGIPLGLINFAIKSVHLNKGLVTKLSNAKPSHNPSSISLLIA